ncbi:ABC transporter ATP-binding protein [Parasphaerochaeta coccoides]|uniref:Amino acid/amide ABC transporter ATP-binding protein 1, HAAT family n=1 Tax=Parasphaerochaeta coccoides (strain ATCC BAA-1237 / DSM 17374 / SPN1) TaxID=760011 RepID=F4GHZ3_PARC1|nr:ABC transporter ATP-binding protein [Parasphaerochaeta coccoides]AEC02106.1 amino acid/amide ABC transporter ATP-binding protein 1, HAAT family [Parasphaerochaeta coccoides DSM 17374]
MTVLHTQNMSICFGGLTAVMNLNLALEDKEIVGLIGPNGAGKTTAFNMITGVYAPTSGAVFLGDRNISGLRPDVISNLGIARTFQNIRLFRDMSVLENILVAGHQRLKSSLFASVVRLPSYHREERHMFEKARTLLEAVGLSDLEDEKATSLPYGKQRRLEIARALATEPSILLLDEPAAGMNPQESRELTDFIGQLREKFGLTILLIEHHMQVVMRVCERIYVLDYGQTIAEGKPEEIQRNERVIEAYLGGQDNA